MHKSKHLFLVLIIFVLSSCISKRTNIIVPGHSMGVDSQNESIACELFVRQISVDEYHEGNRKNVIKDAINESCYSIHFKIRLQDQNFH